MMSVTILTIEKFNMMAQGGFIIGLEESILKEINSKDYSTLHSYSKDVVENYEKLNPAYAKLQKIKEEIENTDWDAEWEKALKELEDFDWEKELEDIDWDSLLDD